ncbi:sensor histidine kinase [Paenibacillus alkaliterrae]|uniref:sensor histidine kinase n=1 Tax=Paenibacillus alkaliterrae TaxID=320909 RepID=UPI001F3582D5|nr:sensor histidine kinase [Paenibacillus alkaliterrae]MCF2940879.1 sensor histidine kinase [Paenibacillus alkaliterrae]
MPKLSLNHVKLRDKMLLIYFLCVLIPIVLTNVIFYNVTTNNVKNQKMKDIAITVEKARNDLRSQIDIALGISAVLNTDYFLNESLERIYKTDGEYVDSYNTDIVWILNKYSPVYKSIKQITIFTDNPTIIGGGYVIPITEKVENAEWYREINQTTYPIVVRNSEMGAFGHENMYSVIRKLNYSADQNEWQKIVKIDIHADAIRQVFSSIALDGDVFLIDEDNVIHYSNRRDIDWVFQKAVYSPALLTNDSFLFEERYSSINNFGEWSIVLAMSEQKVLEEVRKSKAFVYYLALTNILVPTLIIVWIMNSLSTRLVGLLRHMKKVKHGSFQTVAYGDHRDEIGQLTSEFNRMTLQIKTLIDDVYVADIQKKDLELKRNQAQLHALQSQINPHFLFNALATIRTRSMMKNEVETAKIIHNMAKIFRKSLQWGKDWVSIREEMDLVLCFLEIQKYRFADKLNYRIEVDDSAYSCIIPKMMLQPLVENASIHGIEPIKEEGLIDIRIEHKGGSLYFTVKDNGVGMNAEELGRMMRSMHESEEMGDNVGIKNIYYRLQMYFNGEADFEITSSPGEGTLVHIRVPERSGKKI